VSACSRLGCSSFSPAAASRFSFSAARAALAWLSIVEATNGSLAVRPQRGRVSEGPAKRAPGSDAGRYQARYGFRQRDKLRNRRRTRKLLGEDNRLPTLGRSGPKRGLPASEAAAVGGDRGQFGEFATGTPPNRKGAALLNQGELGIRRCASFLGAHQTRADAALPAEQADPGGAGDVAAVDA
jgi:hypothetical protein